MGEWEINECIQNQPGKLNILFENAIEEIDAGDYNFGFIKNGKSLMFLESETATIKEERYKELVITNEEIVQTEYKYLGKN